MKFKITIILLLLLSINTFGQEVIRESEKMTLQEEDDKDVPFAIIEKVPVFPGCKGYNAQLKKCMSIKISEHVSSNFNIKRAKGLGLKGIQRIIVNFKIDKKGNVVNIHARGPHPKLEKEAVRVVKSLPKMIPGTQRGENVGVIYSLPIAFKIE